MISVIAVVAAVVGGSALWGVWSFNKIERVAVELDSVEEPTEPRNYLVVSSDSRDGIDENSPNADAMIGGDEPTTGQRSDSLMIARVDPANDRIDLLSIPRDLWVPIAGTDGEQRINTAYAQSAQAVVDTVQSVLDIPINNYVEVNFSGFSSLVDALGGVPMYFSGPVRDRNSGLHIYEPGCHVLNGVDGLAFARARHLEFKEDGKWVYDPTGDLGRMTRQQLLTRAAMAKAQTMGLGDVTKLKGLVDAGVGSVRLDDTLGAADLMSLGRWGSTLGPERIQTHTLPVIEHETSGGAQVVLLDAEKAQGVLEIFRGNIAAAPVTTTTLAPPSPGEVRVNLVNATGTSGEARRVSYVMVGSGFREGAVDPSETVEERTRIEYPSGALSTAELASKWLTPAANLVENPDLEAGTVTVVLGSDFAGVDEPSADALTPTTTTEPPAPEGTPVETTVPPLTEAPALGWTPGQAPDGSSCV